METGALLIGPTLQEAMKHATYKFVVKAGNAYEPLGHFLQAAGEYGGAVSFLPTAVNTMFEKMVGQKIFGSDIYGDFVRDTLREVAKGVADAVHELHGDDLEHIKIDAAGIAVKASRKVAETAVFIDECGHVHTGACPNGKRPTCTTETYEQAAEAGRLVSPCCKSILTGRARLLTTEQANREQSPWHAMGGWDAPFRAEYLRWTRSMKTPEQKARAMYSARELDTEEERTTFLELDDGERLEFLDAASVRIKQRMQFKTEIESLFTRLKELDQSMAAQAANNRLSCSQSWGRLSQPTPVRILGILGL